MRVLMSLTMCIFISPFIMRPLADVVAQSMPSATILHERRYGNLMIRQSLVAKDGITYESGLRILQARRRETSEAAIIELLVSEDEHEAAVSFLRRADTNDDGFDTVLDDLRFGEMKWRNAARLFIIDGKSLYSFRESGMPTAAKSGIVEAFDSQAGDPTRRRVQDGDYRVLTFAVRKNLRKDKYDLVAYVKAYQEPSCEACWELAVTYGRFVPSGSVFIRIRRDVWFDGHEFPPLFRFESDKSLMVYPFSGGTLGPPGVKEYYRGSSELECERTSGFHCRAYAATGRSGQK